MELTLAGLLRAVAQPQVTSQTGAVMSCTSSVANLYGGRNSRSGTPAGQVIPQFSLLRVLHLSHVRRYISAIKHVSFRSDALPNLVLAYLRRKLGSRKTLRARSVVKEPKVRQKKDVFLPNLVRVCGFAKARACAIFRLS